MGYRNLRQFVDDLRNVRDIEVVKTLVDPVLELPEIHRRVVAEQGPALLFERVKTVRGESAFPVVTNLFGTKSRVDRAFGTEIEGLVRQAAHLPQELVPPSVGRAWRYRKLLGRLFSVGTKRATNAPVLAHRSTTPDLESLPMLTTWKLDGGPFVTLPLVYTEHPETGQHNLGMYRMQRFDATSTGMHMQIGKGGGFHLACAKSHNQPLPVNVFLGGPPALILSAIAPLPENVGELLLASFVNNEKIRLTRTADVPLPILAEAEFAICGTVSADDIRPEGPFGDHYGYYSLQHDYPVFRVKHVFHRQGALYPATVVGKPRQEDYFIGNYLQEMLSPLFPVVMPAVRDLWSYGETGYHSLAAAVVRERYKREAMVSAFRILGEGQLALTKFLLLTDKAVDLKNFRLVLETVLERCDLRSDLFVFSNLSMDTLDYTGPVINMGSKGVLLGVGEAIRRLPREFSGALPSGVRNVRVFCGGCLVVDAPAFGSDPEFARTIASRDELRDWPMVVVVDDVEKTCASEPLFLWTVFTRFEPAADIHARSLQLHRFHPSAEPPIVIDARMKPSYPAELECDEETAALVERRWREYFPR